MSSSVFAAMVTVFFYLHIFTGSVGKRLLIAVPVDTLYRTSIISSLTVVLLNPFANLSLALLSLFSIYGPDLGVWPDCWVSAEFLRAPIPRKGSGSTTTTVINRCQFISECESSSLKIMPIYFVTRLVDFLRKPRHRSFPFKSHSFCSLQSLTDCHLSSNQSTKRHLLSNSTSLFRDRGKSARTNHSTRYNLV